MGKVVADGVAATPKRGVGTRQRTQVRFEAALARGIARRVASGEALSAVCTDAGMPGHSTVYRWRKRFPDFAAALREARAVQAERYCEIGWEIAEAVTPADAHAVRVKLEQLRWTAAAFGPRVFGRVRPVEGEMAEAVERAVTRLAVRVRHFEEVMGPDGKMAVRELPVLSPEDAARATPAPKPGSVD